VVPACPPGERKHTVAAIPEQKFRAGCFSLPNYSAIQVLVKRESRSKDNLLTALLLNVKGLSQNRSLDLYAYQASIEIRESRTKLSLIVKMKDATL
jgi:hypothetical protein